jgi:hypothetical protein
MSSPKPVDQSSKKSGYLPPHLKAKLPPKELTLDDIKSESLFPILSSQSPNQKNLALDFSQLLKEDPVLPLVVKERTPICWHLLSKVIVYDMDDEDFCKSKKDLNFFSNIETPPIKKKNSFLSLIERYLYEDKSESIESDV